MAGAVRRLTSCATKCQIQQAKSSIASIPFDEEACEESSGTPYHCGATFDRATQRLLARGICPPCINTTSLGALGDEIRTFIDQNNGNIYCAGTVPLGGDDPGFVPPDSNTATCEHQVARNLSAFGRCVLQCRSRAGRFAWLGRSFDEQACESGPSARSCTSRFAKRKQRLLARGICPSCLQSAQQDSLTAQMQCFLAEKNGEIFCAGTVLLTP